MRYSLRQLQVFLATAHYENITRAAESLSMSQSAASSALKDLEKQFDVSLFDRLGKRLKLSELGRTLRPKVQALVERAEELEKAFSQHGESGVLRVGATTTIGDYLAVDMMAKFLFGAVAPLENHSVNSIIDKPEVSLTVENTASIARKVVNFELDIGLIEGEVQHPELKVTNWRQDELKVFCHPNHPWVKKPSLTDEDLIHSPWILREAGSGTRQTFDRAMHGLLSDLNVILELQHTESIKQAVKAGMGLGCLSIVSLADEFEQGTLVPLSVEHRDFKRSFYYILHHQKYLSVALQKWIDLCK